MAYGGYAAQYDSQQYGGVPYDYETGDYYSRNSDYEEGPAKIRKLGVADLTVCVDFLRAVCDRGPRCNKAHVSHISDPEERHALSQTKFCHDFQNRGQCARGTCKFLHVTKREEDEFLMTGSLPMPVLDRAKEQQQLLNSSYNRFEAEEMAPPRVPPPGYGGGRRGRGGGRDDGYGREESEFYSSGYGGWSEGGGGRDRSSNRRPGIPKRIDEDICRDFVRNCCKRGDLCKYLHVLPEDKNKQQAQAASLAEENKKLCEENEQMKKRVAELEQLLADAYQCITAFGEQNPAVQAIVQSISDKSDKSLTAASGDAEQTAKEQGAPTN